MTYAMTRLGQTPATVSLAARGIAVGIISNTALKLMVALMVGRGEFRRLAGVGLTALGIASGVGFLFAR